ncbi:MAG: serine/threonine protein kinase [Cyanobacteria bacterium CRU_2_1]|nr:serine/threonine protein kinase [Cyanobacteria bacterium RU_5_0]NJR59700.1 serine/threonine protein kinase [Cyanobacteria bacterium CRU_2_1]
MSWAIGQRLQDGKYTIEAVLGEGGFGITYRAKDDKGNLVVIKRLNNQMLRHPQFDQLQQDFVNEALWLAKCTHPHIVQIHRVFQQAGLWCMVMEYIDGEDLASWVRRQGILEEAEALRYVQQIGDALTVMHRNGLLHRDVKPQNIMVRSFPAQAVLLDFGIAREFTPNSLQTHTAFLSNGYAPIEQYDSHAPRGAHTDVYALAATLYTLLTGQVPIDSQIRAYHFLKYNDDPLKPPQPLNSRISDRTHQAILQGMAIEASDRPQSVQDWLDLLETPETSENTALVTVPETNETYPNEVGKVSNLPTRPPVDLVPVLALPQSSLQRPSILATLPVLRMFPAPGRSPQIKLPVTSPSREKVLRWLRISVGAAVASTIVGYGVALGFLHHKAQTTLANMEQLKADGEYAECINIATRVPNVQPAHDNAQVLLDNCAGELLTQAKQQASEGNFKEAIEAVSVIPSERAIAQELELLIEQWATDLLQQAIRLYADEGRLEDAIALTQAIPSRTSVAQQLQATIDQWKSEWSTNETRFQEAQQAFDDGDWYRAREKANALSTPHWQAQAVDIVQESDAQIVAIEAEQRRQAEAEERQRAEEERRKAEEAAFSEAEEKCQSSNGRDWREQCRDFKQLCEARGGRFEADGDFIGCIIEPEKEKQDNRPEEQQDDRPDHQSDDREEQQTRTGGDRYPILIMRRGESPFALTQRIYCRCDPQDVIASLS